MFKLVLFLTAPRAPRMELSTPNPTSILVTLALPSWGSPITGYKVFYKHKGAKADEGFIDLRAMMTSYEFTDLGKLSYFECTFIILPFEMMSWCQ